MSYLGPPPTISNKQTFGVGIESDNGTTAVLRSYRNGVLVERCSVPSIGATSSTYSKVFVYSNTVTGQTNGEIDRVNYLTTFGGSPLGTDDFATLAAWTETQAGQFSVSPASYAFAAGTDTACGIYQHFPAGAGYIEAVDVYEDTTRGAVSTDGWVAITLCEADVEVARSNWFTVAHPVYGVLLRFGGEQIVFFGTPLALGGWGVGMVRMGGN